MARLTTTSQKRTAWISWLDKCRNGDWANPSFFGRTIGGVPVPWVDAIRALEAALKAGGYTPKSAWAYNFRGIGGKSCSCSSYGNCSLHGFGIAIDIDPRINPYVRSSNFSWASTAFSPNQIALIEGIKNTKGEQVWFWGGRWFSIKDYMHFEAYVDPASTAINWSTVPGEPTGPIPTEDDEMALKKGDKGNAVGKLQVALMNERKDSLPKYGADKDFGDETEAAVKDYQRRADLPQTGQADGVTFSLLMEYVADRVGGGGGVSAADVDSKIAAHAAQRASSSVHPHTHDEGKTSGPQ
jgi:hypothetical protein